MAFLGAFYEFLGSNGIGCGRVAWYNGVDHDNMLSQDWLLFS